MNSKAVARINVNRDIASHSFYMRSGKTLMRSPGPLLVFVSLGPRKVFGLSEHSKLNGESLKRYRNLTKVLIH